MGLRSSDRMVETDSEPMARNTQHPRPNTPTRRYNTRVPAVPPEDDRKQNRRAVYASEATGLVVVALLVLVIIMVRYWHNIHWSLR